MSINQVTITNAAAGSILVPAPGSGSSYANVGIFFCNYSTSAVTVDVYLLPTDGTPANANSIMRSLSLQPKETFVFNVEKFLLGTGNLIRAVASAGSSVVATASYIAI